MAVFEKVLACYFVMIFCIISNYYYLEIFRHKVRHLVSFLPLCKLHIPQTLFQTAKWKKICLGRFKAHIYGLEAVVGVSCLLFSSNIEVSFSVELKHQMEFQFNSYQSSTYKETDVFNSLSLSKILNFCLLVCSTM